MDGRWQNEAPPNLVAVAVWIFSPVSLPLMIVHNHITKPFAKAQPPLDPGAGAGPFL